MALNYVTVTETFNDGTGAPVSSGIVTFTPSSAVYAGGVPVATPANPIVAQIVNGALKSPSGGTLQLLATDNTGVTIEGLTGFFYWTVVVNIGGVTQTWSFFLPHSPATVDLYSLANTAASGGGSGFSNPMTTLGDIIYENATPAAARLAGSTSATKQFLTQTGTGSVSAAPAWGALAAADVPGFDGVTVTGTPTSGMVPTATSGSAATWQASTGIQSLTFTYGSSGAVPSSGTFTAGAVAVDQNDILRVCTVSGTPGTWQRAYARPYQFFIDDYGAKGDGAQALVTTVAGSAVINTTPLATPATPSPTNATSGGSIAAGVVQVKVTYTNRWGETVASAAGSTTTTTTASTVTVPSPAASGNATGWYAYVTQPGGSTFTRQQGSPTAVGTPVTFTSLSSGGGNAPGSDSSAAAIFTSTAVDGGKNIQIPGGLGSPGAPWIDTILSVQSSTQATLSTNGASQGGSVSQAGCAAVFASDDRLAIDNCITAAYAYAVTHNNFCQVIGSNKTYGLGTGLFQSLASSASFTYNTQVRIPAHQQSGQTEKLEFQLIGPGDAAANEFWVSALPNLGGFTLVSFSNGPNSPDPTYGQQSIVGGPTGGAGTGTTNFFNVMAVIKGVRVYQPGWYSSIGIDVYQLGGCAIRAFSGAYAPGTATGGGIDPSTSWTGQSFWINNKVAIGMRLPNSQNNDDLVVESFATMGMNTGLSMSADHAIIHRLVTINCDTGLRVAAAAATNHALHIAQWSFENVNSGLITSNTSSIGVQVDITMDGENSAITNDINDANSVLTGQIRWNDLFRSPQVPTVTGAANVQIINNAISNRAVHGAPTYTLGTAFQNPWWLPVWVQLSGGTVTNVQVGPTSAAATTSLATATPTTFLLPSGWWLNITGTVKPTTFNAVPV